jgi:hypothetical protein
LPHRAVVAGLRKRDMREIRIKPPRTARGYRADASAGDNPGMNGETAEQIEQGFARSEPWRLRAKALVDARVPFGTTARDMPGSRAWRGTARPHGRSPSGKAIAAYAPEAGAGTGGGDRTARLGCAWSAATSPDSDAGAASWTYGRDLALRAATPGAPLARRAGKIAFVACSLGRGFEETSWSGRWTFDCARDGLAHCWHNAGQRSVPGQTPAPELRGFGRICPGGAGQRYAAREDPPWRC